MTLKETLDNARDRDLIAAQARIAELAAKLARGCSARDVAQDRIAELELALDVADRVINSLRAQVDALTADLATIEHPHGA